MGISKKTKSKKINSKSDLPFNEENKVINSNDNYVVETDDNIIDLKNNNKPADPFLVEKPKTKSKIIDEYKIQILKENINEDLNSKKIKKNNTNNPYKFICKSRSCFLEKEYLNGLFAFKRVLYYPIAISIFSILFVFITIFATILVSNNIPTIYFQKSTSQWILILLIFLIIFFWIIIFTLTILNSLTSWKIYQKLIKTKNSNISFSLFLYSSLSIFFAPIFVIFNFMYIFKSFKELDKFYLDPNNKYVAVPLDSQDDTNEAYGILLIKKPFIPFLEKSKNVSSESFFKKDIPHLSEEKRNEHYIICNKIDKTIRSLAFTTNILSSIDLFIDKGDVVVILGPSGSGKTTLLNIMAGIDKPTGGHIYIGGECITDMNDKEITNFRKDHISYIYQRYGLIPILSALDNIKIGQELIKKENRNVDLQKLCTEMGLDSLLEKFPHELSGGQKQRVAILRAIAKQPTVMFCDEPTGALDKVSAEKTIELFLQLNKDFKTTIIIVTHDNSLVKIANKVFHLRDGSIWKVDNLKPSNNIEKNLENNLLDNLKTKNNNSSKENLNG